MTDKISSTLKQVFKCLERGVNEYFSSYSYGNKTFLTLPSPRYLGPALNDQAVYIGSSYDKTSEILVFKGKFLS